MNELCHPEEGSEEEVARLALAVTNCLVGLGLVLVSLTGGESVIVVTIAGVRLVIEASDSLEGLLVVSRRIVSARCSYCVVKP